MELTLREMKIISRQVFEEESSKKNINGIFRPLTFVELYGGSRSLVKKTALQKISNYLFWTIVRGFYNPETNEIVVFLDKVQKIKK